MPCCSSVAAAYLVTLVNYCCMLCCSSVAAAYLATLINYCCMLCCSSVAAAYLVTLVNCVARVGIERLPLNFGTSKASKLRNLVTLFFFCVPRVGIERLPLNFYRSLLGSIDINEHAASSVAALLQICCRSVAGLLQLCCITSHAASQDPEDVEASSLRRRT